MADTNDTTVEADLRAQDCERHPGDVLEALKASEERYRNLFEYSLNGFDLCEVVLDDGGRPVDFIFLETNQAFGRLTGLGAVVGKRVTEVWPGVEQDPTFEIFGRVALTGQPARFEQFVASLGRYFEFSSFSPSKGQVAVISTDITDRKVTETLSAEYARELAKKNEQLAGALSIAREAQELKREFLNMMSHEIRTPMNGVLGMTDLLLDTALDNVQREYAEEVKMSAEALMELLEDMLDLSKIEAGKLGLDRVPFTLSSLIGRLMSRFEARANSKGLTLACPDPPHDAVGVFGDEDRLHQVLANLVGNAIKFTECGGVTLRVRITGEDADGVKVRFEVEDTGIGITEAQRAGLFQSFVQGDGSLTRKYGGAGLGLAISQQLVEMMGGEIGVSSEPGQGSFFWFVVPLGKKE